MIPPGIKVGDLVSMVMEVLELLLFLAVGFWLRCLFLPLQGNDNDWHIWKVREVTRSGRLFDFSHRVSGSMTPGWHVYAVLHHCLIGRFPERWRLLAGKLLNYAYDVVAIAALYIVARTWLFAPEGNAVLGPVTASQAFVLLLCTAPVFFPINARLIGMGGRVLGNVCGIAYLVALAYAHVASQPWAYALGVLFVFLATLSSKFGLQAIAFFSAILSLLWLSPLPVLLVAGTLAVTSQIPALGVKLMLRAYIDHWVWYVGRIRNDAGVCDRNRLADILSLPRNLLTNPAKAVRYCLLWFTPTVGILAMPLVCFWIYWGCTMPTDARAIASSDPVASVCWSVSLAGFILFALTSIRPLVIFGESERYFAYSAPFMYCLTLKFVLAAGLGFAPIFYLLLIQLLAICIQLCGAQVPDIRKQTLEAGSPDFQSMIGELRRIDNPRIVTLPSKLSFRVAATLKNDEARYWYGHMYLESGGRRYMDEDVPFSIIPNADVGLFKRKYGINTFVVERNYLPIAARYGVEYPFEKLSKVYENNEFAVYAI